MHPNLRFRPATRWWFASLSVCALLACAETLPGSPAPDASVPLDHFHAGCGVNAVSTTYYVERLHVPTEQFAMMGGTVGFDLDGVDGGCGVDDWAGQVDNALVDLAGALPTVSPNADLRGALDSAFCTRDGGASPPRVGLRIELEMDSCYVTVSIRDADGNTLAGPFSASISNGVVEGAVASLDVPTTWFPDGLTTPLRIEQVRLRATIGPNGLSDLIIGGQIPASALEQTMLDILPSLNDPNCEAMGDCIAFSSIAGLLSGLYDVPGTGGRCGAAGSLSVGLIGSATTDPTPPACPAP